MPEVTPTARRDESGRWLPGQSANPGGKSKSAFQFKELCRSHSESALNALIEALSDDDAKVRVMAANAILDRAWGKPGASESIDDEQSKEAQLPLDALNDDQLKRIFVIMREGAQ